MSRHRSIAVLLAMLLLPTVAGAGTPDPPAPPPPDAAPETSTTPPVPPASAAAATPASLVPLSLAEVVERARAASPRLRQLGYLRDGAEAGLEGAEAERRPQVDLTASYSRLSHVPELSVLLPPPDLLTVIFPDLPDRYTTRLGFWMPLYTGGRNSSLVAAAEKERTAAEKDLVTGEVDLVLEATTAYWNLLTARESEQVLIESVATYESHLGDARNREKLGLAARNEVLQVQVERDRADLSRIQAATLIQIIQADLGRLLDLPAGSGVEPTDQLAAAALPVEPTEDLVARALAARPDRAALLARAEAAEARIDAARADRRPQARFSAGYDLANPNTRILPPTDEWEDTWDASVSFSFRVFDSGRAASAVDRQTAASLAAREQLEDLDRKIRLEVTQRRLDLETAAAEVALTDSALDSARESRRVAADRFRAGVILSSELLDAETALMRAGLDRTGALARQRLARARLDRALGS